jgi:hypothetical protein
VSPLFEKIFLGEAIKSFNAFIGLSELKNSQLIDANALD